jgi:hypothetical protein
MCVLRLAVNTGRWDLAAHTLLFVAIKTMADGGRSNAGKRNKKSGRKGKNPGR